MRLTSLCLAGAVSVLAFFAIPSVGRADSLVDQLRAQAAREFGASNLTAGYAALIEFAVGDDVSADRFFVGEGPGQLDVDVYKLPIPFTLFRTKNGWRVFGQATFGYLLARQDIESVGPDAPGERIKSTWRSYGVALGVGVEIPITKRLSVEPFVFFGYARLENSAEYFGPVSTGLLKPAVDGILFDWTVDALTFGASLAVGYKFSVGKLDVKLKTRFTRTEIRTIHVNGDFSKFNTVLNSIGSNAELVHPLPITVYGRNLSLVMLLSNTVFVGPDADALGFTYYFELGMALQLDLTGYNLLAKRIRLGANGVVGPNITGYSLILKASF